MNRDPLERSGTRVLGRWAHGPALRFRVGSGVFLPFAVAAGLVVQACAPRVATHPLATPAPTVEAELLESTRPTEGMVLTFEWSLSERASDLAGRGVARLDPPYRVRLDLFTENGETAARAALVDDELRTPPDVDERLIPRPPLLWASLGVFHPGSRAELLGGEALEDGRSRLRYRMPDGNEARFLYRETRLVGAQLTDGGYVLEQVELEWEGGEDVPKTAVYRDVRAFRELRVVLESREPEDSFPPEIWLPQWR